MTTFSNLSSILSLVKKATCYFSRLESTANINEPLALISSIVGFAEELTTSGRLVSSSLSLMCHKLNAYIKEESIPFFKFGPEVDSFDSAILEFRQIIEISPDYVKQLHFHFPARIKPETINAIDVIFTRAISTKIVLYSVPLEVVPLIYRLKEVEIKVISFSDLESSLVALQKRGIFPGLKLKLRCCNIEDQVTLLPVEILLELLKLQNVKVGQFLIRCF
jgi:phospholipid N-methyltransferase